MSGIRSLLNLLWIVLRQMTRIAGALVRGNWALAGGFARNLYLSVHEDFLKGVVAVQRRLPLWRGPSPDIDRILIVKLDRIGDMVCTTPVLDALHELYPRARIDIVGHPGVLTLLDGDPRVAERLHYRSWLYHPVPILPPGPGAWALILRLMFRRYPLVVYLRGSIPFLTLGLVSRLAATRYVVHEPIIDRYFKALRSVCGPVREFAPRLHLSPEDEAVARQLVGSSTDGPCVTIHATSQAAVRTWPAERFAALADQLHEQLGARVHFLGGPADRPIMDAIAGLARHGHAYHTSLRLRQTAAVIAASDTFVGNDSGLAHMAAAVGTPAVVLWGAASLTMSHPKAPPERCTILYHDLPCRATCDEVRCHNPSPFECLMRTQVRDVVEAVAAHLARRRLTVPANGSVPCAQDAVRLGA